MLLHLLFGLLLAKTVEPYATCDRNKWNAAETLFNDLSTQLADLDTKIHETCKHFTAFAAREVFGGNSYRLEVILPGFSAATFDLKVKHRVVYINAHYPRTGKDVCDLTYCDIKVLPDFVNTHDGRWTYDNVNQMLIVAFRYSYQIADNELHCSDVKIDETLIKLRRGFPNEKIFQN